MAFDSIVSLSIGGVIAMKWLRIILCLALVLFLSLDALAFPQARGMKIIDSHTKEERTIRVYEKSYALCIGIDKYKYWPQLNYSVMDSEEMKKKLESLGFDEVKIIKNEEATRDKILSGIAWLGEVAGKNDRIVIYFSGHGGTDEGRDGQKSGYIIPVDCPEKGFYVNAISMGKIREATDLIKAKHILYIMDCCYSGVALITPRTGYKFITDLTRDPCIYIITAGKSGEKVIEMNGHGIFTKYILKGLDGEADYEVPRLFWTRNWQS